MLFVDQVLIPTFRGHRSTLGPSGAGKTTFMNVLSGRAFYGTTEGTVKINGRDARILDHRHRVGFVPQDDIVHDDLTGSFNKKIHEQLTQLDRRVSKLRAYTHFYSTL
jgi:ABC-type multidrug transport system ATPase subunit